MSADGVQGGFRLQGAGVRYGSAIALAGIDLEVAPGEAVALVGPSGAGKTTLLRLLNGAVAPTSGTVSVGGADLGTLAGRDLRTLRAGIGFVHQDLRLVPNLRVSQNVLSGRLGRLGFWSGVRRLLRPPRDELEAVHRILERVGIAPYLFQRVDRLSGGQAQRVAIARALYQAPHLLLADEPVASVDPARADALLALLRRLGAEDGLTLAVSLHDPDLARRHFDRVVGLRAGRVVFDLPAAEAGDARLAELYRLESDHEF